MGHFELNKTNLRVLYHVLLVDVQVHESRFVVFPEGVLEGRLLVLDYWHDQKVFLEGEEKQLPILGAVNMEYLFPSERRHEVLCFCAAVKVSEGPDGSIIGRHYILVFLNGQNFAEVIQGFHNGSVVSLGNLVWLSRVEFGDLIVSESQKQVALTGVLLVAVGEVDDGKGFLLVLLLEFHHHLLPLQISEVGIVLILSLADEFAIVFQELDVSWEKGLFIQSLDLEVRLLLGEVLSVQNIEALLFTHQNLLRVFHLNKIGHDLI